VSDDTATNSNNNNSISDFARGVYLFVTARQSIGDVLLFASREELSSLQ
jgi:hypothetical protein